jgi:phosphoribosylanthranilate isomerase
MLIAKVKICGITNYNDALAAVSAGADVIGLNFYEKSPRYITPDAAAEIVSKLPAFIDIAGVFVNETFEKIQQTIEICQLTWVQFHGDETPEFCNQFRSINVKTIKAIRVKEPADIKQADLFNTDAVLLDAFDPSKYGGTGISFDWNVVGNIHKRIFLAGGINPENAEKAVKLGVYGIDVCSGLESEPGKKDHEKMKQLFDNIRHYRA